MHLLLVSSDPRTHIPVDDLAAQGHRVTSWQSSPAALVGRRGDDIAVVLDAVGRPDPALTWARRLRSAGVRTPVLLLVDAADSAALPYADVVDGMVLLGATPAEWAARVRLLRRRDPAAEPTQPVPSRSHNRLSTGERVVLTAMAEQPGRVFSRDDVQDLRGVAGRPNDRAVDVFMSRLRRKLDDGGPTVEAVFRRGYRVVQQRAS